MEQRHQYVKENPWLEQNILVTGKPRGITNQRRFIVNELIPKDEWFITMDDNVREFRGVEHSLYPGSDLPVQEEGFDKTLFEYWISPKELLERFAEDVRFCDQFGIHYVGFATVPNYYFLGKKYRFVGYIISKVALIHNVGVQYDQNLEAMEDYGFVAEHLFRFGQVLINNWIIPVAGHYEPGGIGTYEERLPRKLIDCQYLMAKYPGLFRFKEKTGCHPKGELQIRFTSTKQVAAWRLAMLSKANKA